MRNNTKDHIIHLKDEQAKYSIVDQYKKMARLKVKVFFNYEHMPLVGINYKVTCSC